MARKSTKGFLVLCMEYSFQCSKAVYSHGIRGHPPSVSDSTTKAQIAVLDATANVWAGFSWINPPSDAKSRSQPSALRTARALREGRRGAGGKGSRQREKFRALAAVLST